MKHLILIAILFSGLNSFAQKIDVKAVPAPVISKFNAFYPKMKKVTWEKENENFEAEFKDPNKVKTSVVLTADGNIKEVETEIKQAALPKHVNDTLPKLFPGYKIEEISKIDASGFVTYEVEVEKGKESLELIFTEAAALLSKKAIVEGKKD